MNVLLIAHAYPPDPVVGAFRARNVASAFRDAGHHVHVLAARLPGEADRTRLKEPGLWVDTVKSYSNPLQTLSRLKTRLQRRSRGQSGAPENLSTEPGHAVAWKRHVTSVLRVPDQYQGFVVPATIRALRIPRSRVDLLYTTAPPFSDHLVGLLLKGMTGVRWAAELRDPWTDNPLKGRSPRSTEADAMDRWLERKTLTKADHVIVTSESTCALLRAKLPPSAADKFITVLNGIEYLCPTAAVTPRGRPFRILHAGNIYQDRDPRPFFRGLASIKKRLKLGPSDIEVQFVGQCRYYQGISLEAFTAKLGVADIVHFQDWVPQEECRRLVLNADLLLLLAQNHRYQALNKVYDYLGARKPILAFAEADGESARMLTRIGGHYIVSQYDRETVEGRLERVLREPPPKPAPDSEALLELWSTQRQMAHLVSALET